MNVTALCVVITTLLACHIVSLWCESPEERDERRKRANTFYYWDIVNWRVTLCKHEIGEK